MMLSFSVQAQPPDHLLQTDHPALQEDYLLQQAYLVGNERYVVQSGVATLDATGSATVTLPGYFRHFCSNYRYQLTPIGGYAQLYIAQPFEQDRFQIAAAEDSLAAGFQVSWQITGVRSDAVAERYPFADTLPKPYPGTYIDTSVYRFEDVLEKDLAWKNAIDSLLRRFIDTAGLAGKVLDWGVVGSLAAGTARRNNTGDPSDADFVIYLDTARHNFPAEVFRELRPLVAQYRELLKRQVDFTGYPDLMLSANAYYTPQFSGFVFYSLRDRKMYHRPEGRPRYIKPVFYRGCWYAFNRFRHNELHRRFPDRPMQLRIMEDGRLAYTDAYSGEVLLRALP